HQNVVDPSKSHNRTNDRMNPSSRSSKLNIKFPKKFHPARQKAIKALKIKNYDEAIIYLTELLDKYPDSYSIRCDRGEAYMNIKEYERAKRDLDLAVQKKPKKERGLYLRGIVHDKLNNPRESISDLCKAIKIKPNDPSTLDALKICAKHYKELGNFDDAIKHLELVLKLEENN
ncbi:13016_t:CDS:1, partial [Racocetra fulgida]